MVDALLKAFVESHIENLAEWGDQRLDAFEVVLSMLLHGSDVPVLDVSSFFC